MLTNFFILNLNSANSVLELVPVFGIKPYTQTILFLPIIIFTIGVFGVAFNQRNLIVLLLSLELILLAASLNFIFFSLM
jgi:hypothetical protein